MPEPAIISFTGISDSLAQRLDPASAAQPEHWNTSTTLPLNDEPILSPQIGALFNPETASNQNFAHSTRKYFQSFDFERSHELKYLERFFECKKISSFQ